MGDTTPSGGYTFRLGLPSDAEEISRLVSTTWEATYGPHVTPADLEGYLSNVVSTAAFARELAQSKYRFVLAFSSSPDTAGEELVGMTQLTLNSTEEGVTLPSPIELQRFYVEASRHGTGLAGALMNASEDQGRKEGAGSIWLGVWENADRARGFYKKCGFEDCGEHDFPVGTTMHRDVIMQKRL